MFFVDAVSIGYFSYVDVIEKELAGICQVQHGPWDVSDGGAGATTEGVVCDMFCSSTRVVLYENIPFGCALGQWAVQRAQDIFLYDRRYRYHNFFS